jgi:hypothetical protein
MMASTINASTSSSPRSSPHTGSLYDGCRLPIADKTSLANACLTSPSTPPSREFTIFTELPYELQNMVWRIAACEPRVVEIETYTKYFKQAGRRKTELRFLSRTLVPAILHACTGSRTVGIKNYERLCFGNTFTGSFINWTCDYIRFDCSFNQILSDVGRADTKLSELAQKCQRLIISLANFENWSRSQKFRNLEEAVLLCDVEAPRGVSRTGTLTLVQLNDPNLLDCKKGKSVYQQKREEQFKTLMNVDDLEVFAAAIRVAGLPSRHSAGQYLFQPWDTTYIIQPFQKVKAECKSVVLMSAIRGKEEGMTKERKAERKRMEKAEAQRKYRLAHPDIPWHDHGFDGDCHCIECTGTDMI